MAKSAGKTTVSTGKIVKQLAMEFNLLPQKVTRQVIAGFIGAIKSQIISGNAVRIDQLGIVRVRDRSARKGRNPQTGEVITIPAAKRVTLRPAKSLKDALSPSAKASKKVSAKSGKN